MIPTDTMSQDRGRRFVDKILPSVWGGAGRGVAERRRGDQLHKDTDPPITGTLNQGH